ncbi:hypothetical protein [Peribacillus sp. TH24]|uniref:hypothetical protein n=1 Tax=Peribacillus sp. TH24 TaxID=2798483 RepID=UPI001914C777|nr:hypothetical protein [Peribacillus sp. TH24]MBK5446078.1 hypothetical protein [Peribacillus sp. TH24]
MLMYLGLISIVSALFFIIAAVISAFRKTRKVKKRLLSALGSFILLFVFYAISMSIEGVEPSAVTEEKTAKITREEYNKIKDGMTLEEVKSIVGGKEKSKDKFDDFIDYDFDGENGVEKDATVTLMFKSGKLDVKMEDGLVSPHDTEVSTEEDTEEDPTESLKDHIDYQLTEDNDFNIVNLEVNEHMGTDIEDDKIVILTLSGSENLTAKMTANGLFEDSNVVFQSLFENTDVEEAVLFWQLPVTDSKGNTSDRNVLKIILTPAT